MSFHGISQLYIVTRFFLYLLWKCNFSCFSAAYTVTQISWPYCVGDASKEKCSVNQAYQDGFPDVLTYVKCFDDNEEEMNVDLVGTLPPLDLETLDAVEDSCQVDTTVDPSTVSGIEKVWVYYYGIKLNEWQMKGTQH